MTKPTPTPERSDKLQKVLASHGFGSRRIMEQWIGEGRIKVNGKVATIGDRVTSEDRIAVDGRRISQKAVRPR
ncbi:MAG: 23S rRNA pseudouridylate synthase B, partial [Proteobacteria bacterium]|nr:23S rRNA pseudouridylate synthase B [Pseudomonadota bacterium]